MDNKYEVFVKTENAEFFKEFGISDISYSKYGQAWDGLEAIKTEGKWYLPDYFYDPRFLDEYGEYSEDCELRWEESDKASIKCILEDVKKGEITSYFTDIKPPNFKY